MAFQTGLSGLNAASRNLDVIGNNIANANTVGMKSSRTEFTDIVSSAIGVTGGNSGGIGVDVGAVSQQFSQGNITITGNDLDVAINGGGFFQLNMPDKSMAYTRDGQFKLDKLGNVVTNAELNHRFGFDADWIRERTGILERRHAPANVSTLEMSVAAAEKAIRAAGVDPKDIDLLVVGTFTPDTKSRGHPLGTVRSPHGDQRVTAWHAGCFSRVGPRQEGAPDEQEENSQAQTYDDRPPNGLGH